MTRKTRLAALGAMTLLAIGCGRSTREWRPEDHDQEPLKPGMAAGSATPGKQDEMAMLIETTWSARCANCHGRFGKGDGPNGAMVKAADLTNEKWQAATNDAQIIASIKNGKNRMPPFNDLSQPVIAGLVARIRASRGQ